MALSRHQHPVAPALQRLAQLEGNHQVQLVLVELAGGAVGAAGALCLHHRGAGAVRFLVIVPLPLVTGVQHHQLLGGQHLAELVEHGHDLRTGTRSLRAEGGLRGAAGNAVPGCPENGLGVDALGRHVLKRHRAGSFRLPCVTPKKGHNLCPRASCVRRKLRIAGPGRDAAIHCPAHRIVIVVGSADVGKAEILAEMGAVVKPPEEGHGFRKGAACIR